MDTDKVYDAIIEDNDEARWAYGTEFSDPLAGISDAIPSDVNSADFAAYCLMLGDDALVLSHRLQQWCGRAPELEEEVALANIGLDLLGQARLLLTRAGAALGRSEDDLAFARDPGEFRNVQLVEVENGDFAASTVRLLIFSTWRLALLTELTGSRDPMLAAIAAKGIKEVAYHRDYAIRWALRLGDGTPQSHRRMRTGLARTWPLLRELFGAHPVEARLARAGIAVDPAALREECVSVLGTVVSEAGLQPMAVPPYRLAGRAGEHTPALTSLLAEMQSVARANPGATW